MSERPYRGVRQRRTSVAITILMCMLMAMTGCMGLDEATSGTLATTTTPDRVVMKIINNTCDTGGDEEEDEESLSTGQVKGLTKVKDGFGISYDEFAPEYVCPPEPITDDSYEANKNRGIGYAGLEQHYLGNLQDPSQHIDEHMEEGDADNFWMFKGKLTPKEEQYGCCLRWEYAGNMGSYDVGGAISVEGFQNFLCGNGSGHMQYIAIHALNTDKWCICCPFDYGPQVGLRTAGSGHYGRIGGVAPQVSADLGFEMDGGASDATLTEWWWVENSSEVECGPVDDLSAFTGGGKQKVGDDKDSKDSKKTQATVMVANEVINDITRNTQGDTTVAVAPANANSFVNKINSSLFTGDLKKEDVRNIILHDVTKVPGEGGDESVSCMKSHFVISEDGKIYQQAPLDKSTGHSDNNAAIGISLQHRYNGAAYPNKQLNSLDKLIAYIDEQLGRQVPIGSHTDSEAAKEFPAAEYAETRNHNAVRTAEDARLVAEAGGCDDEEEDDENPDAGGPGIAKKAVEISGTASPDDAIHGKWGDEPKDPRLSKYVSEKNRVYGGVQGWADCGRCAATAVKASGADETFPEGDTAAQYEYMKSSPKWQQSGVMRNGDSPDSICKPGDVLVTQGKGHIMIYVGTDVVKAKYPTSPANFFEGSLNDYYGWCYSRFVHNGKDYAIFRCVKPDNAGKKGGMTGDRATIVEFARSQVGVPYNYDGSWDLDIPGQQLACNGLTRWAYDAAGIEIPVGSREQISEMPNISSKGAVADLIPGDIVCFDDAGRRSDFEYDNVGYRHVAIYAGDGEIIEGTPPEATTRWISDGDFSFGGWFGDLGSTLQSKKDQKSKKDKGDGTAVSSSSSSSGASSGTDSSGGGGSGNPNSKDFQTGMDWSAKSKMSDIPNSTSWFAKEDGYVKAMEEKANQYWGATINGSSPSFSGTLSTSKEWFLMTDLDYARLMLFHNEKTKWEMVAGWSVHVGARGALYVQLGGANYDANGPRSCTHKGVFQIYGGHESILGMNWTQCYFDVGGHGEPETKDAGLTCQMIHDLCQLGDPVTVDHPSNLTWDEPQATQEEGCFASHGCICLPGDIAKWLQGKTMDTQTNIVNFDRYNPTPGLGETPELLAKNGWGNSAFEQWSGPTDKSEQIPMPSYSNTGGGGDEDIEPVDVENERVSVDVTRV